MHLSIQQMQGLHLEILAKFTEICKKHNISYYLCGGSLLGAVRHNGTVPWHCDFDIMVPEQEINHLIQLLADELDSKYSLDYHSLNNKSMQLFPRIILRGYDSDVFHVDIFRLIGFPDNAYKQKKMYSKTKHIRLILKVKSMKTTDIVGKPFIKRIIIYLSKVFFQILPYSMLFSSYNKLCSKYPYETAPYAGYLAGRHGIRNMFKRDMYEQYISVEYSGIRVRIVKDYDFYLKQIFGDYMKYPPKKEQEEAMKKTYIINKSLPPGSKKGLFT